jgi:prepilin-type N-terminal cleavage/methylation domain-containing protein
LSLRQREAPGFKPQSGFSLLELSVVVLILLVVGTISIPTMMTVISNARLRGGATNLSGLLQNCRMLAVKENVTKTTRFDVLSDGPVAYVKDATDSTGMNAADPKAQLGTPLTKYTVPAGVGAPPQISSTQLGYTAVTTDPSFNSRGIPCAYSSGSCTNSGFVYYFKDRRPFGESGWAAVSISPAGRIKRWFWNGAAWAD